MQKPLITSRQNTHVKNAVKLRERKQREQRGQTLIHGVREIARALAAGVRFVETFVCKELFSTSEQHAVYEELLSGQQDLLPVTGEVFEKLTYGGRSEGMVAVVETPRQNLVSLNLHKDAVIAVLECIEKPGNIGAVARSADATGVSALLIADERTDLFNPNAIRASSGVLFSMPTAEASSPETLAWLKERGRPIFVAKPEAKLLYTEADYTRGGAIVLGSEADGVSDVWKDAAITPIRLPMLGTADSLNVSVAGAVLFYEALRQRGE